jgi:hypothetical protein
MKPIGFFFVALLTSCAQIGTIDGGEEDFSPPQINSMTPPNRSIQFNGGELLIEFDEFIKLNNPTQTITVIPPDFKVNASVKGKTVKLTWTEDLHPETTYSIFLNKTIQDITETNDSIMQLVFSTGEFLDSMSYSVAIIDAKTAQPIKSAIVGLFSTEDSLKPSYFAESDAKGMADFSFVKQGTYFLRTFIDENKDLKISLGEKIGFKTIPISLDSSIIDSIPMILYDPIVRKKITGFNFLSPGLFSIAANTPLADATMSVNGVRILDEDIRNISKDSLLITLPPKMLAESASFSLEVATSIFSDSSKVRITDASKGKELFVTLLNNGKSAIGNYFEFSISDKISGIDTSKFIVRKASDSTRLYGFDFILKFNQLFIDFPTSQEKELILNIEAAGIYGFQGTSNKQASFQLKKIPENQFGTINLDASKFEGAVIIEMYVGQKFLKSIEFDTLKIKQIKHLFPGEYSFKVILDGNKNEYWDTGDFEKRLQPEKIIQFSEPTKVRANWEINVELVPTPL